MDSFYKKHILITILLILSLGIGAFTYAQTTVNKDFDFSNTNYIYNLQGLSIGTSTTNNNAITFSDGTVFDQDNASASWTSTSTGIIYNGGNVGIGVSSPNSKLDVNGAMYGTIFYDKDNTSYYLNPSGTSKLYNADGVESIRTSGIRGGNNGVQQLNIYNRVSIGWPSGWGTFPTAPSQGIYTNGGAVFSGNVGIGTQGPNTKLDIRGSASIEGPGHRLWFDTYHNGDDSNHHMYIASPTTTPESVAFYHANTTPYDGDAGDGYAFRIQHNGILETNGYLDMNSNKIIDLAGPTAASDAATKSYVDSASVSQADNAAACNADSTCETQSVSGSITSSGDGDTNQPFKFSADYSGWATIFGPSWTSNNGWGMFWAGNNNPAYYSFGESSNPNQLVFVGGGNTMHAFDLDDGGNAYHAGDVGIGITGPEAKIDIRDSANNAVVKIANSNNNAHTWFNYTNGSNYITGDESGGTGDTQFRSWDSTNGYTNHMIIKASGNVGIGDTTPDAKLDVNGSLYTETIDINRNGQSGDVIDLQHVENSDWPFIFRSSSVGNDNASGFWINSDGTPDMRLRATGGTVTALIHSNGTSYLNGGNVGIGVTSPSSKLEVNGNITLSNDNLLGVNELRINDPGEGVNFHGAANIEVIDDSSDNNLSIQADNEVRVRPGGGTVRYMENRGNDGSYEWVGYYSGSSRAGIFLWDGSWNGCDSGEFCITGDSHQLQLKSLTGDIEIDDHMYFNGTDIKNVDKIDANTVDPIYTIGDQQYATYMAGMTGVKEETTGSVQLTKDNQDYTHTIDFQNLEKGSDLWIFYQTSDFGENWNNLSVLLTGDMDAGYLTYKEIPSEDKLIIHGQGEGKVSYRLTAPRFDHEDWSNDYEGDSEGMTVPTVK